MKGDRAERGVQLVGGAHRHRLDSQWVLVGIVVALTAFQVVALAQVVVDHGSQGRYELRWGTTIPWLVTILLSVAACAVWRWMPRRWRPPLAIGVVSAQAGVFGFFPWGVFTIQLENEGIAFSLDISGVVLAMGLVGVPVAFATIIWALLLPAIGERDT